MGVLGNRYISMRLFIIHFLCCLGWLCNIALAQFEISEGVTGSANPSSDIEVALVGNLAVFITSLLRGRLDLEMGARDLMATRKPQLYNINKGFGVTTCEPNEPNEQNPENRFEGASVVMLSYNMPNASMKQFMRYICNAYQVHSILLQCFPLKSKSVKHLLPGLCHCKNDKSKSKCNCIVFWNVEEIVRMLCRRMPGKLQRLSDSLYLLPSPQCLLTGCHGCKQGELEGIESDDIAKGNKAVEDIFKYISDPDPLKEENSCICVPLSPSGYDYWTKLLKRSFGATDADSDYSTASLIMPRLAEVAVNIVLTAWFKVDGFSSALVARRAVKNYVVDEKGSGFPASAFLMKAMAKTKNDCRVLRFRGTRSGIRVFSSIVASANLICTIGWAIFVALRGGKWYDKKISMPPSKPRVIAMIIFIFIALCMDCLHLRLKKTSIFKDDSKKDNSKDDSKKDNPAEPATTKVWFRRIVKVWFRPIVKVYRVCLKPETKVWFRPIVKVYRVCLKPEVMVIILEIVCIIFLFIVLRFKWFRRWLYSALQILVWIKWGVGSYLLGEYPPEYDSENSFDNGILVFSSAFLLNSVLAGVRREWQYNLELKS